MIHCIRFPISRTSVLYSTFLFIYTASSGAHPTYIRGASRGTSGVHPAPNPFYIRGYIIPSVRSPPIIEQSCARDIHFFLSFYYFIIMMFERFDNALYCYSYYVSLMIHCAIMHQSIVHPFYNSNPISRTSCIILYHPVSSCTQSVLHPRIFYIRYDLRLL